MSTEFVGSKLFREATDHFSTRDRIGAGTNFSIQNLLLRNKIDPAVIPLQSHQALAFANEAGVDQDFIAVVFPDRKRIAEGGRRYGNQHAEN